MKKISALLTVCEENRILFVHKINSPQKASIVLFYVLWAAGNKIHLWWNLKKYDDAIFVSV